MIIVIAMKIIALIIITGYDSLFFYLRELQLPPALIFLVLSHTCSVFKGCACGCVGVCVCIYNFCIQPGCNTSRMLLQGSVSIDFVVVSHCLFDKVQI